jgi:hypothetical protein
LITLLALLLLIDLVRLLLAAPDAKGIEWLNLSSRESMSGCKTGLARAIELFQHSVAELQPNDDGPQTGSTIKMGMAQLTASLVQNRSKTT